MGMLGLPIGLSQMSGRRSRTNPTEADAGGGEPGGGPEQEGVRGVDATAEGQREQGRSGPRSTPRRGQVFSGGADLVDVADVSDPHCHGVGAAAPATQDEVYV